MTTEQQTDEIQKLPKNVVGLSAKRWQQLKVYAVERAKMVTTLTNYDLSKICSEELAEQRVVIRHKDGFEDPLWKEKDPIDVGVVGRAFGVSSLLQKLYN